MAKVNIIAGQDWHEIARQAGAPDRDLVFDPNESELEVPGANQAALDLAVAEYATRTPTAPYKKRAVRNINNHCAARLQRGLEWPAASGQFLSLSDHAQLKWLLLFTHAQLPTGKQQVSFPITVPTLDDGMFHTVTDFAEVEDIYSAMGAQIETCVSSATAAKQAVKSATTIPEVDKARADYLAT